MVTGVALGSAPALAMPGDADSGFGTGGVASVAVPHDGRETLAGVALDAGSQKTLIAGTEVVQGRRRMFVTRLTSFGGIDTTFGGGKVDSVATNATTGLQVSFTANAMVRDTASGAVTVVGSSTDAQNGEYHAALMRVTSTGSRDATFGSGGEVVTDLPGIVDEQARGVTYDAGGNLYVVGDGFTLGGDQEAFIARYTSDGTLDTTFAGDGVYLYDAVGADDTLNAVVVTGTGVIAAGKSNHQFLFVKVSTLGIPVPAFDTDGVLTVDFASSDDEGASAIALETVSSTEKLVAAGTAHSNFGGGSLRNQMAAVRIDPTTGALDPGFDGDGKVLNDFGATGATDASATALAVEADQELLLAGSVTASDGHTRVALLRLTTGGAPATTAGHALDGNDGLETFAVTGTPNAGATAVALDASGTATVVGQTQNLDPPHHGVMARVLENGTFDGSFLTFGQALLGFNTQFPLSPVAPVVTPAGDIVVGMTATIEGAQQFALVRLHADGSPDTGVGATGLALLDAPPLSESLQDAAADGERVVLFGASSDNQVVIERATAAGALDAGFGTGGVVSFPVTAAFGVRGVVNDDHTIDVAYGQPGGVRIRRYLAVGTPDPGFGTGGTATLPTPGPFDLAFPDTLDLRPDGGLRIVTSESSGGSSSFAAYALSAAGAPVPAYGTGGRSAISTVTNPFFIGGGVDASGRLVVVGARASEAASALLDDGQPDAGFGTAGVLQPLSPAVQSVAVLPDGRALVTSGNVRRLLTDGNIDTSFGGTDHTAPVVVPGSPVLATDPSGALLLAGSANQSTDTDALTIERLRGDLSDAAIAASTPAPVTTGQAATVTVTVSSGGPQAARGVVVTPSPPSGVSIESATPSQGTCTAGARCSLGTIEPSATATVALVLRTSVAGTFDVPLRVGQLVADSVSGDDTATAHVTVSDPAPTPTPTPAGPGPTQVPAGDTRAPRLSLRIDAKRLRRLRATGRLIVDATLDEAGTVRLTARVGTRVLGRATVPVLAPGTRRITLTLSRAGRALIKRHVRRVVALDASVTDAAGNRSTAAAKATLRR